MDQHEALAALALVGNGVTPGAVETETLDFQQVADSPKATFSLLADTLACFMNARGGTVVLGVDDSAVDRSHALKGVPESYSVDSIRKGIFDRTRPPITAFAHELLVDGVRLILLTVPEGVVPHSNTAGLSTRRQGTECLPYSPGQQREVMIARGHVDWSADASGLDVADLSGIELDRLRRILSSSGRGHSAELPDRALVQSLQLIAGNGSVTNAGALLLADEATIDDLIPTYGYSYRFRPTAGSEATERMRGSRPLMAAVQALARIIEARREILPLAVAGGVQLSLTDYPSDAVSELIINGFIHRSYEVGGTVDVEQSPQCLAITSPGELVTGVTPSNILTYPPTPRNRLLTETVSLLLLAERTGPGVDRTYREMLRVGKEPPIFEEMGGRVRATLAGGLGNESFARFVNNLPARTGRDLNALLALSCLRHSSSIEAVRLATIIQRTPVEAQGVLTTMASEYHLIEPTRRTFRRSFPTYRLRSETLAAMSRSVTYGSRTIDDTDHKVVEHVREYGFVTNQTIRRLFDLHVYAARDLLTDLRERDILEKIGNARGGAGVRYGPGSKFPPGKAEQSK
ncbi:RNA-binding domain-containing protein [Nonomuraea typhae]|uniref:RNA-binding domain-containing protein n=1 Tax=Nonomuraea typhae TaxID=2603600 RepID=UPI0015E24AD6|nr:RNA-binding domain-containing protein [Nonomuraea typhae]